MPRSSNYRSQTPVRSPWSHSATIKFPLKKTPMRFMNHRSSDGGRRQKAPFRFNSNTPDKVDSNKKIKEEAVKSAEKIFKLETNMLKSIKDMRR